MKFLAVVSSLKWVILLCLPVTIASPDDEFHDSIDGSHVYTNTWAVEIQGGARVARDVAENQGFHFHGPLGSIEDHYIFEHKEVNKRSRRSADDHHQNLKSQKNVLFAEQQKILSRKRRGYVEDPDYRLQWYLKNTGQTKSRCSQYHGYESLDINVVPVWEKNITGQGVVVCILDDGLEYTHPDLKRNYEARASHDYNGNDNDPMPRYTSDRINKHGTRCAGEVAGERGNGVCGRGVAYNSRVGGIRMLDGEVTDAVEAGSLSFASDFIDIYSSSWGPDDDGKTVDGPGPLAKKAFRNGIKKGRKGRGSIFVWATGNGGRYSDYCSCDGYINSPFTISIGAVDNCGRKPWYSEACPGTFAVTYSSGEPTGNRDKQISTTDLSGKCTHTHTGTSAAAPLAAGIFALVLEANRKLTWRDLQHLVAQTSKVISPDDSDWQTNGAGHKVNVKFGFGALDTNKLVEAASSSDWKTAKKQHICETDVKVVDLSKSGSTDKITSFIETDSCGVDQDKCVTKVEHVHVAITLQFGRGRAYHTQRGKHSIVLTSPSGTRSDILRQRARDTSYTKGFENWEFLTVLHWDESPKGKWKLTIRDASSKDWSHKVLKWRLKFSGTCDIKNVFNIKINETEICGTHCREGCPSPNLFATECVDCSQYCDCTRGECVPACEPHLEADDNLRHCKRSLESKHKTDSDKKHTIKPAVAMPLSAKFAIICLSLVVISLMVAGIAYFAAKMPSIKNLPKGYHAMSKYPCAESTGDQEGEEEEGEEDVDAGVHTKLNIKS